MFTREEQTADLWFAVCSNLGWMEGYPHHVVHTQNRIEIKHLGSCIVMTRMDNKIRISSNHPGAPLALSLIAALPFTARPVNREEQDEFPHCWETALKRRTPCGPLAVHTIMAMSARDLIERIEKHQMVQPSSPKNQRILKLNRKAAESARQLCKALYDEVENEDRFNALRQAWGEE